MNDPRPAGLSRRSLVTAGAWSVPAVALAVATPASATSQAAPWNVTLTAPNSSSRWYDANLEADRTFYNEYNDVGFPTLFTYWSNPAPAGLVVTMTWDNRVRTATPLGNAYVGGNNVGTGAYTVVTDTLVGNTRTWAIATTVPIPVSTSFYIQTYPPFAPGLFNNFMVWDDLVPATYIVSTALGETNTTDNSQSFPAIYAPYA